MNVIPAGSFLFPRPICRQKILKMYSNNNIKIILLFYINLRAVTLYSVPIAN